MYNELGFAIEQAALPGTLHTLVGFMAAGVAIAYTDDFAFPCNGKSDEVVGIGHFAAFAVYYGDIDDAHILAIGQHGGFVGGEHHFGWGTRGFDFGGQFFAFFVGDRFEFAGFVIDCPLQVAVAFHLLFAQAFAIQKQLHIIGIGIDPHIDGLATFVAPIPVRRDVQHVFIGPPTLVVVIQVFGKTTHVHHPEVRADVGPLERSWFTPIIEARPDEAAEPIVFSCRQVPPLLGAAGPPGRMDVLIG